MELTVLGALLRQTPGLGAWWSVMHLEYTPFAIPYIVSGIITLVMAVVVWKRRSRPGATGLCCFMLAMAEWSLGNAMEMCSVGVEAKTVWSNIEYVGIATMPVAWLAAALGFSGKGEWLRRRNILRLLIIPAVTQVLVWTNGYHGLMRYNIRLDTSGPFSVIVKTYGPWFWIAMVYSYTLLMVGTISVTRMIIGLPGSYKAQARLVVVGVLAPWAANVLYISGSSPIHRLDMTPIAFIISGLAAALGILRYRLLDIHPIAWATMVEGTDDGIVVTDLQDRVLHMNPAAQALTGWSAKAALGGDAADVMGRWPSIAVALAEVTGSTRELALEAGDERDPTNSTSRFC